MRKQESLYKFLTQVKQERGKQRRPKQILLPSVCSTVVFNLLSFSWASFIINILLLIY